MIGLDESRLENEEEPVDLEKSLRVLQKYAPKEEYDYLIKRVSKYSLLYKGKDGRVRVLKKSNI